MASPLHKHDCNNCKYLKTIDNYDYYFCKDYRQIEMSSIVARSSSEPSDYWSMLTCLIYRTSLGDNKLTTKVMQNAIILLNRFHLLPKDNQDKIKADYALINDSIKKWKKLNNKEQN